MKHNISINSLPYIAALAVIGHRFITLTATGVTHASATTPVVGVSGRFDVNAGETVEIVTAGFIPVEYGETIAQGDRVGAGADGKAVKSETGNFIALEEGSAGSIGSVVAVLS